MNLFKKDEEKKSTFTINDVTPEIYQQLETEFYQNFDFMKLYTPTAESGILTQFGTHIIIACQIVLIILLWVK